MKQLTKYLVAFVLVTMIGIIAIQFVTIVEYRELAINSMDMWNKSLIEWRKCIFTYQIEPDLEPCACCGEFCWALDCDWDNRYQIDSENCVVFANKTIKEKGIE